MNSFFRELKQRKVYRVALGYAVVAWLVIQVSATIVPVYHAPEWILPIFITAVALGFPVALVLAWAFEVRGGVIEKTPEPTGPLSTANKRRVWLLAALGLIISAFAIGSYWFWYPWRKASTVSESSTAAMPAIREKSIAVLPFENLSRDPDNAYFAEGIKDEILTKLATVHDLKVISRTSTAKYQSKPDNLRTVAQELGVTAVLEGAVQKAGDKVRVNVQLIDARANTHLWAKSYDRELKDVFSVESDIAQDVTDTLQARLSPSESHVLTAAPTRDPEAYDLFLKAEYEVHQGESTRTAQPFARAVALYQQAFTRDPKFALAYARLAYARLFVHFSVRPLTPAELDEVKSRIDGALALEPDLPEAHLALGLYRYWGYRDYGPAIAEFHRALELQPSNARARVLLGFVFRRQGEWEKSLAEVTRAQELDPLDVNTVTQQGLSYVSLRRWNEAQRLVTRAIAIDPHFTLAAWLLARICENNKGDIQCARRAVENVPPSFDPLEVRYNAAAFIGEHSYVDLLERNFAQALQAWDKPPDDNAGGRVRQLEARVAIQVIAGRAGAARSEAEELRGLLESKLKEQPEDVWSMTGLSWAYACLGRNVDALEIARRASDVLPVEKDALSGPRVLVGRAEIAAHTGQAQEAIEILRRLASMPAGSVYSVARLKIDPVWDPIRNRPDFQQLLSTPEQVGPNK